MVAVISLPLLLAACSNEKPVDEAELAGRAANHYYHRLMEGGYDDFVSGMNGADGYPEYSEEWKKCNTICDFCNDHPTEKAGEE